MRRLAISALLAVAACSPAPEAKKEEPAIAVTVPVAVGTVIAPTAPWSCADGQGFALTVYGNPDYAELVFADGARLHLSQSMSASGALYEDTTHSFHAKGDEALLIEGGRTTTCRAAGGQN